MKNVWRKLRDNWLDFWEDDELDMDKKHLSQHDKRSLLYGGFMISTFKSAWPRARARPMNGGPKFTTLNRWPPRSNISGSMI